MRPDRIGEIESGTLELKKDGTALHLLRMFPLGKLSQGDVT